MRLKLATNTRGTRIVIKIDVDTDTFLKLRDTGRLTVIDGDVIGCYDL